MKFIFSSSGRNNFGFLKKFVNGEQMEAHGSPFLCPGVIGQNIYRRGVMGSNLKASGQLEEQPKKNECI